MKHVVSTFAVVSLLASVAPAHVWGADVAVVSGVVRDAHGTPQLGAAVELLGPDATVLARSFTDDHGRYFLTHLPGSYELRASAAFLLPVVRGNVRLRAGARAVADLTMTAVFEAGSWLPTEGRKPGEAADDWRWTLRSAANRPMLRLLDTGSSSGGDVSSREGQPGRSVSEGQLSLLAGDGSFGEGGARQVLTMHRAEQDGGVSVLRASVGHAMASGTGASVALSAGLERKRAFGGETRVFVNFSSDPELQTGAGAGLEVLRTATSERFALGDMVAIDAGTLFTAERLFGTRFDSSPYVRLAFHPSPAVVLEYRLATDRNLQRSEDLNQTFAREQALSDAEGHPILKRALHQEIAATEAQGHTVVSLAVYRDSIPVEGIEGGGNVSARDLSALPVLADQSTGTFRVAVSGYSAANGARVSWTQVVSPTVSACVQGELGTALERNGVTTGFAALSSSLRARAVLALSAAVDIQVKRTGTGLDLRYRWQPRRSLTQVDEFDTAAADAYVGMRFEQRLWAGRGLRGVKAVAEATNLLAQGYEPLLGADGKSLFLAQVPRGVQGGLAYSF